MSRRDPLAQSAWKLTALATLLVGGAWSFAARAEEAPQPNAPAVDPALVLQICEMEARTLATGVVSDFDLQQLITQARAVGSGLTDAVRSQAASYARLTVSPNESMRAVGLRGLERLTRQHALLDQVTTASQSGPEGGERQFRTSVAFEAASDGSLLLVAHRSASTTVNLVGDNALLIPSGSIRVVMPDLTGEGAPRAGTVEVMGPADAEYRPLPEYILANVPSFCRPQEEPAAPRPSAPNEGEDEGEVEEGDTEEAAEGDNSEVPSEEDSAEQPGPVTQPSQVEGAL
ncbi:MAG: hypothetical protein IT285_00615 [Bdellovibrionales bacterium]|nr:hypothetical protein [Bdellovibrionales bacterium]